MAAITRLGHMRAVICKTLLGPVSHARTSASAGSASAFGFFSFFALAAGAFSAGAFLTGAFFADAFFAGSFFADAFFAEPVQCQRKGQARWWCHSIGQAAVVAAS